MDVGVEFGQYRVIEHIGRGGMADVWSARDKRLNRTVAIKTVARDLSHDMNPVKLFEREAQTIANLEHPHILPIYEFGDYDGQLYIVMRYVSGGSLEDLLEDGPLPPEEVMRLARMVAQALDYAHENKVVHLDLKPSNILLDSYQLPYLADFGLATVMGPEGRAANPGSGTLLYMAPEQLTAEVLDQRADVYSFSIMLFHMMTGQLPFDAVDPAGAQADADERRAAGCRIAATGASGSRIHCAAARHRSRRHQASGDARRNRRSAGRSARHFDQTRETARHARINDSAKGRRDRKIWSRAANRSTICSPGRWTT